MICWMKLARTLASLAVVLVVSSPGWGAVAGTAMTYQGRLNEHSTTVNGSADFEFGLFDAASGGGQVGPTRSVLGVSVVDGLFTVAIDFGPMSMNGQARWLEIAVRAPAGAGEFTTLSPRQPLTPAPMALALPGLFTITNATSPNLVGGCEGNIIGAGIVGATIGGGGQADNPNRAMANYATVAGGSGNTASGEFATVPGGTLCQAAGSHSAALGRRARANHNGCFVFGDSVDADVNSSANNQWTARVIGGARFYTNLGLTAGVVLAPGGGSWTSASDRAIKRDFQPVDSQAILERVERLPIQTWSYQSQDASIRHIGPTAQDFMAAFQVGEDDRHITTVDADGVALAAIQGLCIRLQKMEGLVTQKIAEIEALQERLARLEAKLGAVDQPVVPSPDGADQRPR